MVTESTTVEGANGRNVARRALTKAAEKLGGLEVLASRVGVTTGVLRVYLAGSEPMPDALFLRIVDVLIPPAE